ncbi:OLC1v1012363C1 [Oldenlandia corymbosa var. corymbosa]|uniref:OLC1v1012363C1 n=1 Tax=Oldenlandia corymbosa var. corymbosa TaxID=529605 RepID=A0AAV1DYT1_OLDCO|nr:OLC1v1012363C1 [Oldenlandia corymbosa var. corymbosa]
MNRFISNPVFFSSLLKRVIFSSPHFLSTSATATETFKQPWDAEELSKEAVSNFEDIEDFSEESFGIIQDKDFLRKTTNGGLYVLDLIDTGAIKPNASLYNKLLKRCTQFGKLKEGRLIHAHFLISPYRNYITTQNALINMYAKCGSLDEARKVFDEMYERDMVSWTAVITGFAQNGKSSEALGLFSEMFRNGFVPNQFTLGSALKASAVVGSLEGRQLHGISIKIGLSGDVFVGSALVDMYARCDHIGEAKVVFDGLQHKNEVCWNALIAGHARKSEAEDAVRLFAEMRKANFEPTHFTYSSVFAACANVGALEQGKWVHGHLIKSGVKVIAFVGNTLLAMYGKAGSIADARKVFDRLVKRDVVSWNSMLTVCAQHGLGRETVERFEQMRRCGIQPNEVTFLCVLTACSHSGLINEGLYYFELMKKLKLEPDVSHYVTIVDLFGRAGKLGDAEKFIQDMPIKPTAAIWKALLGACRMHKNIELGAFAAECVFELDPHDSGPHILLANIYASAGRKKDAAKVRKIMNDIGVKKEPACSWLEIENSVHLFVANDDAHPQKDEIYKKWEEIADRIRAIGYVPDTSHVLWFVDQQERELRLQLHSEKLALAFALLKTPPGSTIRIKKNIRVCGDCHTAFKFVSQIVGREIILRDTNRFHHFLGGSCSCGDYW